MNILLTDEAIKLLGIRRLPGRLTVAQASILLGFNSIDVPVLIAKRLLRPLGNPDVFRYPDDYTKQEILGQEYLYAVKRHLALLNITPDLTPPRSKRAGNWKPINKVLAMRQIPEMEVA